MREGRLVPSTETKRENIFILEEHCPKVGKEHLQKRDRKKKTRDRDRKREKRDSKFSREISSSVMLRAGKIREKNIVDVCFDARKDAIILLNDFCGG